jgi:hypothetical protein
MGAGAKRKRPGKEGKCAALRAANRRAPGRERVGPEALTESGPFPSAFCAFKKHLEENKFAVQKERRTSAAEKTADSNP